MKEVPDNSINLIITSPPYFNIKDYEKDGYQEQNHSQKKSGQIGDLDDYNTYLEEMNKVWKEAERVLAPNGKLAINSPLMPMLKKDLSTHYNRDIFDIDGDIQSEIRRKTNLF